MKNDNADKMVWLRYLTPILVTISLFFIASLKSDIEKLDTKMFNHLTNDEIHIPRGYIVTKSEFQIQKEYLQGSLTRIRQSILNLSLKIDALKK